ncbi:MAG: hypothetical protein QOI01_2437 [Mycobacterium sp.]|nr:hypothetical protein [Mycobacterium sp.]
MSSRRSGERRLQLIPLFNARAESGQNYWVLSNVSTLSGAPPGLGGTSAGKLYFDVVGGVPNSVVYDDGVQDLLAWVATATPAMPDGAESGGSSDTSINGGPTDGSANTDSAELGPSAPRAPVTIRAEVWIAGLLAVTAVALAGRRGPAETGPAQAATAEPNRMPDAQPRARGPEPRHPVDPRPQPRVGSPTALEIR